VTLKVNGKKHDVRGAAAGVTLMELLIAVTLLSLLSGGMFVAMRMGLSATTKAKDKLMANRRVLSAQRILEQQIAGIMPVAAEFIANPNQPGMRFAFFQGDAESMRFVSTYSLQEAGRGLPRILEFQVIPGEKGKGVRLVVNESLYTGPGSTGQMCAGFGPDPDTGVPTPQFRPIEAGPGSFVLADHLASCRFIYRELRPAPEFEIWHPHWPRPSVLPTAIRVEMTPLDPDPSGLQVLTVTAAVRINKVPLGMYED
jgi:general secretion pathway protein J